MPVTRHPSRSSRPTIAAPIPELAPVTRACGTSWITSARRRLRDPRFGHAYMLDRPAMKRECDVQRAIGRLLDRGVRQFAVGLVAGIVRHAIAIADLDVSLGPASAMVRRDGK